MTIDLRRPPLEAFAGGIDLAVLICGTTGDGHECRYVGPKARDHCTACGCSVLEWERWKRERRGRFRT